MNGSDTTSADIGSLQDHIIQLKPELYRLRFYGNYPDDGESGTAGRRTAASQLGSSDRALDPRTVSVERVGAIDLPIVGAIVMGTVVRAHETSVQGVRTSVRGTPSGVKRSFLPSRSAAGGGRTQPPRAKLTARLPAGW